MRIRGVLLSYITRETALASEIKPILQEQGFSMVEIKIGRSHKLTQVTLVVYRSDGMDVDELSRLNRRIRPLLENFDDLEDLSLVVSSPGVDRKIKSEEESTESNI